MKPLIPSHKENKRYFLVSLASKDSKDSKEENKFIKEEVEKAIFDFIGVFGFSKLGFKWIKVLSKKKAVFCINREKVDEVRAGLLVWPEKICVDRVSGTLKSLREKSNIS